MRLHYIIHRKDFFKGSFVLVITTVASYILGLLRDRMLAQTFGASRALDAYNAAFTVPDLLLNIFVAGALSAAFVPIFSELDSDDKLTEKSQFINSVLNGSLLVLSIAGIVGYFFAPQLAHLLVPGFSIFEQQEYVGIVRILLLSPLIFALSNTLGSILVSRERFFWFGMSAVLYNAGIIAGVMWLSPIWGIYGVAVGAIIGALLHLMVRIIGLWKFHFVYRAHLTLDAYYRQFLKLMVPKMIGHPVEQLTFMGYTIMASTLGAGSIVVLNLARNFQSAPVAILGINLALVAFPTLSRLSVSGTRPKFHREVWLTGLITLLATSASALFLYVIREPLIRILIGGGAFDAEAIQNTAATLGVFVLAIPTESLSHVIARAFYALKNSLTPTIVSIGALLCAIVSGYFFSRTMGVPGLALGFFSGSLVKIILLTILLRRETRSRFS